MNKNIAVIGLGYVGLPLAVEFAKKFNVIGYDINKTRINEINNKIDSTNEIDSMELEKVLNKNQKFGLRATSNSEHLVDSNIFIVTVPTPVDLNNKPDLNPLKSATELVSKYLKKKDLVIYETTVYPGLTEEFCVPIIEKESKLKYNKDFFVGYSPERINPGDKEKTLTKIVKVTSGSNMQASEFVDSLYKSIIKAGTHKASSIKVAEAAKVIENSQRILILLL